MKIYTKILSLVLVLLLLVSSPSVALAASPSKPAWSGTAAVRIKVLYNDKEIKPSGVFMADDAENYFAVKDIAKLFKDTKKKFNFKFNPDKNTLTFYPGKAYNSKDTGVTVKRNKVEAQWTASTASNRGTKVYIDSKKVNMTVYILNGTFYMKLIDIAKIADCAIAYSSDRKKVELNVNKPYNGEEDCLLICPK